jgi:hypothetical protein
MTAETPRRGMIRKIADLPAYPGGAAIQEVEVGGVPYQSAAGASGIAPINQTVVQLPLATDFLDVKQHAITVVGSVVISGGAAVFSGGGGVISIADHNPDDMDISCAPYTIEAFFKTTQAAQQNTMICERDDGAFHSGSWAILINQNSAGDGKVAFYSSTENNAAAIMTSAVGGYNDGVRHHVAVCRIGAKYHMWVDGVLVARQLYNGLSVSTLLTAPIRIGNSVFSSRQFIGTIDNFRYIIGVPAYSGWTFTVPTPPFPTS